jgi:hypothetical protein
MCFLARLFTKLFSVIKVADDPSYNFVIGVHLQKTVVRADLIGSKCKTAILSAVAKLEGTIL